MLLFLNTLPPEMHYLRAAFFVSQSDICVPCGIAKLACAVSASQMNIIKKLIFLGKSQQTILLPFWLSTQCFPYT